MAEPAAAPATGSAPHELSGREVDLVRCTYRVMARQGGHRLSLQDIADEAGVSKGLLLYHFKTKDNLLLATMRWVLERTAARIRDGIDGAPDARAAIGALVDAVFVDPERNRDFHLFYLDLVEHAARVPSFGELTALMRAIVNGLYTEVIRAGVDEGLFEVGDVDDAAVVMRAVIDGTFLQWLQAPDWRASHAAYKVACHDAVLTVLGART